MAQKGWSLGDQCEAVLAWLTGESGEQAATRVARRRGLGDGEADDLRAEAWVRVREAFNRRTDPYPEMHDPVAVARFGYRVLDNLALDRLRAESRRRRREVARAEAPELEPVLRFHELGFGTVEQEAMLRALLDATGSLIPEMPPCPGCPDEIVAATALEVLHALLNDTRAHSTSGAGSFDGILYASLRRARGEPPSDGPADAAERQRKARCGRCVVKLLTAAAHLTGAVP